MLLNYTTIINITIFNCNISAWLHIIYIYIELIIYLYRNIVCCCCCYCYFVLFCSFCCCCVFACLVSVLIITFVTNTTVTHLVTCIMSVLCHYFNLYAYIPHMLLCNGPSVIRKEGNVIFNDPLNTFYLRLYGVRHMVNHPDSERENPLLPHGLIFPITSSKGYFIYIIPHTR